MGDNSKIQWTQATWNPVVGCSVVSPGCKRCYAMGQAARCAAMGLHQYDGTTQVVNGHTVWTGRINISPESVFLVPLHWKRPRLIFVNSMSDLFHEDVSDEVIDRVFAVMALCPHHTFQVLTKRPERMRKYMVNWPYGAARFHHVAQAAFDINPTLPRGAQGFTWALQARWPLSNVWLGTSAEDQTRADERVPFLRETPAALRFISFEPLLGMIHADLRGIGWVIAGGESGHGARAMHPAWARRIMMDCRAADIPFFFKQWGEWGPARQYASGDPGKFMIGTSGPHSDFNPALMVPLDFYPRQFDLFGGAPVHERLGKKAAGHLLDGVEHQAMPS